MVARGEGHVSHNGSRGSDIYESAKERDQRASGTIGNEMKCRKVRHLAE